MGLFSFASKTKQEGASGEGEFYSRAEEDTQAARGRQRKPRKSAKSSNSPVDPVLPEKKRARRRLVGAIALVLAMIIVLPMILDSEPKPLSDDISIQIPSKDKPGALPAATPVGPAIAPASATNASATASAASVGPVPLSASLGQQEQIVNLPPVKPGAANGSSVSTGVPTSATPVRMPAPAAEPATPAAAATTAKAKAKDEVKPTTQAHEATEPKPVETKVAAKVEHNDARAEAILEGKDTDSKANAEKKSGKFIVQVAALATQEKVDELQGKLTEAGIKSFVQKVATDSGERIMRVRIGPFASKDEAESARAKLGKMGLNGKLLPSS